MDQAEVDATYDIVHQAALSGFDKDCIEWQDHPLFRQDLPDDVQDDRYLSALQYVTYEGETKESVAAHYKEIGNDLFRNGKGTWLMAAHWWTKALELDPQDDKLKSILHSNRATVSLGLGQFQKASIDANWAIHYDKTNKKAFLRAAHAYQGMADWDHALSAARAGLEITLDGDPLQKPLQDVIAKVNAELSTHESRVNRFNESLQALSEYFSKRKFAVGKYADSWQGNFESMLRFDEGKSETIWPIAISFEEVLQIDFIEGFYEKTPLNQLLSMVLPGVQKEVDYAPWDTDQRYCVSSVVLYTFTSQTVSLYGRKATNRSSKAIEIDPTCSLADVFAQPDYVIPGYPILYIAVRDSTFGKKLAFARKILPASH